MTTIEQNTWVELSKSNLLHNVKETRRSIGKKVKLFAVVKANAYGHGQKEIATIIQNYVDGFCVAGTLEALHIRKIIPLQRLIVLSYFTTLNRKHLHDLSKKGIEVPIYSLKQLTMLIRASVNLKVHIKIDTGTSRIGFKKDEIPKLTSLLGKQKNLKVVGIYSHFANVEDYSSTFSEQQINEFELMSQAILNQTDLSMKNILRHISCSAAIPRHKKAHYDAVRLGIHLYGLSGISHSSYLSKLKPVLSWKTKILQIKTLQKNESVGYNRTYVAKKTTRLAILPVGYWDGYDRLLSNSGHVLIKGKLAQIRGNICMNLLMVDVTHIPQAKEDDTVTLLGFEHKKISATYIAQQTKTINYEVITKIRESIPKVVVR